MARSRWNVYTDSLVAIDLDTSKYKWHFDVAAHGNAQRDFKRGNMVPVLALP